MKLIVFCPNWVGDLVMATPALRALRDGLPQARIVGLARPSVVETLAGSRWFDDIIPYHHRSVVDTQRSLAVVRRLRRESFDVGLLLTNSIRTALLGYLGGVRRRIGYTNEGRGLLLSEALPPPPGWKTPSQEPIVDSYIRLACKLGVAVESKRLELSTTPPMNSSRIAFGIESVGETMNRSSSLILGERSGPPSAGPADRLPSSLASSSTSNASRF